MQVEFRSSAEPSGAKACIVTKLLVRRDKRRWTFLLQESIKLVAFRCSRGTAEAVPFQNGERRSRSFVRRGGLRMTECFEGRAVEQQVLPLRCAQRQDDKLHGWIDIHRDSHRRSG